MTRREVRFQMTPISSFEARSVLRKIIRNGYVTQMIPVIMRRDTSLSYFFYDISDLGIVSHCVVTRDDPIKPLSYLIIRRSETTSIVQPSGEGMARAYQRSKTEYSNREQQSIAEKYEDGGLNSGAI